MKVANITAQEVVAAILLPTTTFGAAVNLVEAYARAYASGEVIKAIEQQHNRTMAILEAPTAKGLS